MNICTSVLSTIFYKIKLGYKCSDNLRRVLVNNKSKAMVFN